MRGKSKREFDFSVHSVRRVLLRVCYIGTDFRGFAFQPHLEYVPPSQHQHQQQQQAEMSASRKRKAEQRRTALSNSSNSTASSVPGHYMALDSMYPCTIEGHLIAALVRAKLIDDDPSPEDPAASADSHPVPTMGDIVARIMRACDFEKGGRTDRGVSALANAISLNIRSSCWDENQLGMRRIGSVPLSKKPKTEDAVWSDDDEVDYIRCLNGILPPEIRITGWSPVDKDFSARFKAVHRTYHYYFLQRDLDILAMRQAALLFIGEHDFRNFCKADVINVVSWVRSVLFIDIIPADFASKAEHESLPGDGGANDKSTSQERTDYVNRANRGLEPSQTWCLKLRGSAFLWHQVRCMVAVLMLVGRGVERPEIVTELLNVEKHPCKPNYPMASDMPLILWDCEYPEDEVTWRNQPGPVQAPHPTQNDFNVLKRMWQTYEEAQTRVNIIGGMIAHLDSFAPRDRVWIQSPHSIINEGSNKSQEARYVPLLHRPKIASLEEQRQALGGRKRARLEGNMEMRARGKAAYSNSGDIGDEDGDGSDDEGGGDY